MINRGDYDEKYIKIKSNSGDNLPLNEILKLNKLTVIIRSVFEEDNKYYPKFLQMNVYMSYKDATQYKKH